MKNKTLIGACTDCGTWSNTGKSITPEECSFCIEMNSSADLDVAEAA